MNLIDKLEQKITDDIQRVGWSSIGVFGTRDEPIVPFVYSIGFTELGHAEMIVYGLPHVIGHGLIDSAYDAVKEGAWFSDGDQSDKIIQEPYKAVFKKIPGVGRPATAAVAHYGPVPVLQIVWPDVDGNYPWDEGWDGKIVQPVLADQPDHPDLHPPS